MAPHRNRWLGLGSLCVAALAACSGSSDGEGSGKPDASSDVSAGFGGTPSDASADTALGGASGSGGAVTGGSAGAGGAAGNPGASGAGGVAPNCEVLLDIPGLAHESTAALLKKQTYIPESTETSWQRIDVSLDVYLADWTPKQGQYEVFTLLRANAADHKFRWVGNAVGYIAFIGPGSRQTVMVANLNLAGAAAPDGRRIAKGYKYQTATTYHLEYTYDIPDDLRQVTVFQNGQQVTQLTGQVSVPEGTPPVTSIDVPTPGFDLLMGGEEVAGAPDCSTLGWKFSNVKVVGCH